MYLSWVIFMGQNFVYLFWIDNMTLYKIAYYRVKIKWHSYLLKYTRIYKLNKWEQHTYFAILTSLFCKYIN